jgi:hypothetical protein
VVEVPITIVFTFNEFNINQTNVACNLARYHLLTQDVRLEKENLDFLKETI